MARRGHYKGIEFRSLHEYSFFKHLEAQGYDLSEDIEYEPFQIEYRVGKRGRDRTYTPDVFIIPERRLVEVKNSKRVIKPSAMFLAKNAAAEAYCEKNDMEFAIMTERDFHVFPYKVARFDPNVKWKRSNRRGGV